MTVNNPLGALQTYVVSDLSPNSEFSLNIDCQKGLKYVINLNSLSINDKEMNFKLHGMLLNTFIFISIIRGLYTLTGGIFYSRKIRKKLTLLIRKGISLVSSNRLYGITFALHLQMISLKDLIFELLLRRKCFWLTSVSEEI